MGGEYGGCVVLGVSGGGTYVEVMVGGGRVRGDVGGMVTGGK